MVQTEIDIQTQGRGSYEITERVAAAVAAAKVAAGLCHVFTTHTSASLMICENADPPCAAISRRSCATSRPTAIRDSCTPQKARTTCPAHVRSVLTQSNLTIPIVKGRLALGTWQGVYLWEHRTAGHRRRVIVTVQD